MSKLKIQHILIGLLFVVVGIIIDQVTKYFAINYLKDQGSVKVINKFLYFNYTENDGAAWGMFEGKLWLFYIITIFALGLFVYMLKDFDLKNNLIYSIALSLIISGTLGNFIDRIFRKFVVDFIDMDIFSYKSFPIFNFADIFLTVGVGLLIFDMLFGKSKHLLK